MTSEKSVYTYIEACRLWAKSDHWRLMDAVNLALGLLPRLVQHGGLSVDIALQQKIIYEMALNCVDESLLVINPHAPEDQYRVRPREFLIWVQKFLELPPELKEPLEELGSDFGKKEAPRKLSPKQSHRERCCGIAALLWATHPDLTKGQMANRPEILQYGCGGRRYAPATVEEWIKAENPNRKGGRRQKPE